MDPRPQVRRRSAAVAGASVVLALLLATLPASGQTAGVDVDLTVADPALELDPGSEGTTELTVTNTGSLDGTVTFDLEGPADGWTAEAPQGSLAVPAGESRTVDLVLTAPGERGEDLTEASWVVSATIQDATGQFTDTAQASVQGLLTPAPPPPPPPPDESFPWLAVGGATAAALALGAAGTWWALIQRRERGIEIACSDSVVAPAGGDAYVAVEVRNTRDTPCIVQVDVPVVPAGLAFGLNRSELSLDPGERAEVWAYVRAPENAEAGTESIEVRAKPAEARGFRASATVELQVVEPAADGTREEGRLLKAPLWAGSEDPFEDEQLFEPAPQ